MAEEAMVEVEVMAEVAEVMEAVEEVESRSAERKPDQRELCTVGSI